MVRGLTATAGEHRSSEGVTMPTRSNLDLSKQQNIQKIRKKRSQGHQKIVIINGVIKIALTEKVRENKLIKKCYLKLEIC